MGTESILKSTNYSQKLFLSYGIWKQVNVCRLDNFITEIGHWSGDTGLSVVGAQFDYSEYNPGLFRKYNVVKGDNLKFAVNKRQAEYLVGRYCALKALEKLSKQDMAAYTVLSGKHREPLWPENIVGSISHTSDCALCAVGNANVFYGIGIDLEVILTPLQAQDVALQVHNTHELQQLKAVGISDHVATTILFSAKESLFKGIFSQVGEYFGFEKACLININSKLARLDFKLDSAFILAHDLPSAISCHYQIENGMVLTRCVLYR